MKFLLKWLTSLTIKTTVEDCSNEPLSKCNFTTEGNTDYKEE